jgi:PIN domain nuclease of toxin-antitoxin system
MRLLLDTHAFLWFITADSRLGANAKSAIENQANQRLLSTASLWEMAIKFSLGKLKLAKPFDTLIAEQLAANAIDILSIEVSHVSAVAKMPFHHRDPFDRLLIAQAMVENIALVSVESTFDAYGVDRIW